MSDQYKEADRVILEEVWGRGEVDKLDAIVAPDIVHHDPFDTNAADGLTGMKRTIANYRQAFPDVRFTVEDQLVEGDKLLTRWSSVGTHTGSLMGETPTGAEVRLTGMVVERFEDGKIVEAWRNWDVLTLLTRIGVMVPASR
jgi:predicted ester cyclase